MPANRRPQRPNSIVGRRVRIRLTAPFFVALLEFSRINDGDAKRIKKSSISHKFVHYLPSQPRIVVQVIVILMQVGLTQVELGKRFDC